MRNKIARLFFGFSLFLPVFAAAQSEPDVEPPLDETYVSDSPYKQGYRWGWNLSIILTNYGFSMGSQLEYAVSPVTTALFSAYASGLRDVGEQTFQNVFGQQFIPNKYNRVLTFPVMLGAKQRLFPEAVGDDFRLHLLATAGISPAFVYPYFDDINKNGIQEPPIERINDPLQGWDKGFWEMGIAGELGIGVDFGKDFKAISSVYFGVMFNYFPNGIQVLEPFSYDFSRPNEVFYEIVPDAPIQRMFASPVIRFSFGKSWKTKKKKS